MKQNNKIVVECTTWEQKESVINYAREGRNSYGEVSKHTCEECISLKTGENYSKLYYLKRGYTVITFSEFEKTYLKKEVVPVVDEKPFVLPNHWCIKAQNGEEAKVIASYATKLSTAKNLKSWNTVDAKHYWLIVKNGVYHGSKRDIPPNITQLTFEQFKQYVLKESTPTESEEYIPKAGDWVTIIYSGFNVKGCNIGYVKQVETYELSPTNNFEIHFTDGGWGHGKGIAKPCFRKALPHEIPVTPKEMTKEEELLAEAKRRYPVGTEFRLLYSNDTAIVKSEPYYDLAQDIIWNGSGHGRLYNVGIWAEIVSKPKEDCLSTSTIDKPASNKQEMPTYVRIEPIPLELIHYSIEDTFPIWVNSSPVWDTKLIEKQLHDRGVYFTDKVLPRITPIILKQKSKPKTKLIIV